MSNFWATTISSVVELVNSTEKVGKINLIKTNCLARFDKTTIFLNSLGITDFDC